MDSQHRKKIEGICKKVYEFTYYPYKEIEAADYIPEIIGNPEYYFILF